MTSPQAVPRSWRWVSVVVLVAGAVMALLGAWQTGVSFDEPYHVLRLQNYLDTGWYLLDDDLDGGQPGAWVPDTFVYAPVTALALHGLNVLLGNESPGVVEMSAQAYAVRHLGVALLGLAGVAATVVMGRLLMRSWAWGLVGGATLAAVPMWIGHAMFNIKDVPVATGYTCVTAALMLLCRPARGTWPLRAGGVVALAGGLVLAVGTRPGAWPGLLAAVIATLCLAGVPGSWRPALWRVVDLLVALGAAYLVLLAVYPSAFADPDWVLGSALVSASYGDAGYWWYVPSQVVAGMPLLLLVVGAAGWLAALGTRRPSTWLRLRPTSTRMLLVAMQALLLPLLAVMRESQLYDGLRQLLFACPAAVVLLVWGLREGLANATGPAGSRRATGVLVLLGALAMLVPTAVQARMFPYNYAYASVIVDARHLTAPNDYWRTSTRELLPRIPGGEFVVCSPTLSAEGDYMRYLHVAGRSPVERSRDCRTDALSPLAPYRREVVDAEEPVSATFLAVSSTWEQPGRNCTLLGRVTRPRHLTTQQMSAVHRCELVLNVYPSSGIELGPQGQGSEFLLGGWTGNPAEEGVRLIDAGGSLGVRLPSVLARRDLEVTLDLESTTGAEVSVNNVPVGSVGPGRTTPGFAARREVVEAMGAGRLVVTVRSREGGETVLRSVGIATLQEGSS